MKLLPISKNRVTHTQIGIVESHPTGEIAYSTTIRFHERAIGI